MRERVGDQSRTFSTVGEERSDSPNEDERVQRATDEYGQRRLRKSTLGVE